jgi:hypothetical protein
VPIVRFDVIDMLKDLNVDLCLHFNGECLEPSPCFPREADKKKPAHGAGFEG